MAALEHVLPWDSQPQEATDLDPRFTWGVNFAGGPSSIELASQRFGTPTGAPTRAATPQGVGIKLVSASSQHWIGPVAGIPTEFPITFVAAFTLDSLAVSARIFQSGATNNYAGFYFWVFTNGQPVFGYGDNTNIVSSGNFQYSFPAGTLVAGRSYVVSARFGPQSTEATVNGVAIAGGSGSGSATTIVTVGSPNVGRLQYAGSNLFTTANVQLVAAGNFAATTNELLALSANPWQLFAPRSIWVPPHVTTGIPKRDPVLTQRTVEHEMPWDSQPQEVTGTDLNPWMLSAYTIHAGQRQLLPTGNRKLNVQGPSSDQSIRLSDQGISLYSTTNGNVTNFTVQQVTIGTGDFTLAVYFKRTVANNGNEDGFLTGINANYLGLFSTYRLTAPTTGILIGADTTFVQSGITTDSVGLHKVVASRRNGVLYFNVNGQVVSVANTISIPSLSTFMVGSVSTGTLIGLIACEYYLATLDPTRGWADSEMAAYITNPWSFTFKPRTIEAPATPIETPNTEGYGITTARRPVIEHEMPWTEQPQEVVEVDPQIEADVAFIASTGDVTGRRVTGSFSIIGSAQGLAISSGFAVLSGQVPSMHSTTWTQIGTVLLNGTNSVNPLSGRGDGQCVIFDPLIPRINLVMWNVIDIYISGGALPTGIVNYVVKRENNSHTVWLNGKIYGTASNASTPRTYAGVLPAIGSNAGSGGEQGQTPLVSTTGILSVIRTKKALSAGLCLELSINPWQLFKPRTIEAPTASNIAIPTLYSPTLTDIEDTTARPNISLTF